MVGTAAAAAAPAAAPAALAVDAAAQTAAAAAGHYMPASVTVWTRTFPLVDDNKTRQKPRFTSLSGRDARLRHTTPKLQRQIIKL